MRKKNKISAKGKMLPTCRNKVTILLCTFFAITVQSRALNARRKHENQLNNRHVNDNSLLPALLILLHGRRTIDADTMAKANFLYKALTRNLLRQNVAVPEVKEADIGLEEATLAEHELQETAAKNTSALQQRPFVQHRGENDFLVLKPSASDPFITVVPNDIYYNVEKRCVNWLDDCNVQGIRARLLQRIQSPYR